MRRILHLIALGAGMLTSVGGAAAAVVYHSPADDGVDPGVAVVASQPNDSLYLYVDGGSSPSSGGVCESGSGDEVCAWQIEIQASDDLGITGFVPDASMDATWTESTGELRANGVHALTGRLGATRIGELQLAVGASGSVALTGGASVGADLSLSPVPLRVLAVPEPQRLLLLIAGIGALLGIGRRRIRP